MCYFKIRVIEILNDVTKDIKTLLSETRRGFKMASEGITEMREELAKINDATNESAVEVDRLASLLEQALNRTDATPEEEEAFLIELRNAVPTAKALSERLRLLGQTTPPEPAPAPEQ